MLDIIQSNVMEYWIQILALAVSFTALIISLLAYRRAAKVTQFSSVDIPSESDISSKDYIPKEYSSGDVSLKLLAKRDVSNQLRLILQNTGVVPAQKIDLVIGKPIRVINTEEVDKGITDSVQLKESALQPRLTVIDSSSVLPVSIVNPGVVLDLLAVITMGYGKICDFPISISWVDDRGHRHYQDEVVTI